MRFVKTKCAICGTEDNCQRIFEQNLDDSAFSAEVFSARRLPDRRSYQWVRCNECGLLRSDPVLEVDLDSLYKKSTFDYNSEVIGLKRAYASIVRKSINPNTPKGSILEIGGGNGFFLEIAKDLGFTKVAGVEPSVDAVSAAREDIKPFMIVDMLREDSVPRDSFDVVAMFHVMDHLPDPLSVIDICKASLKPGGTFVAAIHDAKSWSARLLKSRSPIVDVEHTFLFDRETARNLLERAGFVDIRVGSYWNLYSIAYLVHLVPMPRRIKNQILNGKFGSLLSNIKISLPLGNIWVSGKRAI